MLSELSWAFETLKEIKLLALLIKEKQIYHIALAKFKTIL